MNKKGLTHISESPLLMAFFDDHLDAMLGIKELEIIDENVELEVLGWLNTLTNRELCYLAIIGYLLGGKYHAKT